MGRLIEHYETAAFYGFTSSVLTVAELAAIRDAGLDESDAYDIECDLQCGAFQNVYEAIEYYIRRKSED